MFSVELYTSYRCCGPTSSIHRFLVNESHDAAVCITVRTLAKDAGSGWRSIRIVRMCAGVSWIHSTA